MPCMVLTPPQVCPIIPRVTAPRPFAGLLRLCGCRHPQQPVCSDPGSGPRLPPHRLCKPDAALRSLPHGGLFLQRLLRKRLLL